MEIDLGRFVLPQLPASYSGTMFECRRPKGHKGRGQELDYAKLYGYSDAAVRMACVCVPSVSNLPNTQKSLLFLPNHLEWKGKCTSRMLFRVPGWRSLLCGRYCGDNWSQNPIQARGGLGNLLGNLLVGGTMERWGQCDQTACGGWWCGMTTCKRFRFVPVVFAENAAPCPNRTDWTELKLGVRRQQDGAVAGYLRHRNGSGLCKKNK